MNAQVTSEHASTSADDKISLDEVIAKFKATADEDIHAQEILAAATTLRDSTGRDRKIAIRKIANAWGVTVNEKVADKYKPRSNAALEKTYKHRCAKPLSIGSPGWRGTRSLVGKKQEPPVLQGTVLQWQHTPEALPSSCPKRLMTSCQTH